MKKLFIFSVLFLLFVCRVGRAQIPQTISYQGILTDTEGGAVPDGSYNLTFKLYDAAVDGSLLWSEAQDIMVNKGLFNVILGRVNPLDAPFDESYWLGITVGSGSELTPRVELTSSAYSLNAQSIADSAVTGEKVRNNQLVRSINTLTDEITLVEGVNVKITPDGNTLIISAESGSGESDGDWTISGENMYSAVSGNVGIGTTTPAHLLSFPDGFGDKISLWGQTPGANCLGFGTQFREFQMYTDQSYADIVFGWGRSDNLTEIMRIKGNGKVGIGIKNPDVPLFVLGKSHSSQFPYNIAAFDSTSAAQDVGGGIGFGGFAGTVRRVFSGIHGGHESADVDSYNGYLRFLTRINGETNLTERMRILSNGNVGIGTNNPLHFLHLKTSGRNGIRLQGDDTGDMYLSIKNGSSSHWIFDDDDHGHKLTVESGPDCDLSFNTNGPVERMRITKDGYVGIGTSTPAYLLSFPNGFGDKIALWGQTPGANCLGFGTQFREFQMYTDQSYADIVFGWGKSDSLTETMRIKGNGNVGIGTPDPQGKLDVDGTIYQRGSLLHADYVFKSGYHLESIEEHSKFMWKNKHLKAIPKAKTDENGREIVEYGSHQRGIVEELEKAHIYIEQLHKRISVLESKIEKLASE
jgi:hypothetical protein